MREVAALWVRIMIAQEPATGARGGMSFQCTSGMPRCGKPPATGPMVAMPCPAKFQAALAAVAPTTASSGTGHPGSESAKSKDEGKHGDGDKQRGQMYMGQAAADLVELDDGSVGVGCDAEHLAENGDADLKADSSEKAGEHGLGEEVGDEAELQQAREQQKSSGEQSDQAGESNISRAGGGRHVGESAAKDGGCGGVGGDDEIARRAEGCEGQKRQQERIKAGDDRHAGDAGVAEGLRDVHGGEDNAGECIAHGAGSLHRSLFPGTDSANQTPRTAGAAAATRFRNANRG